MILGLGSALGWGNLEAGRPRAVQRKQIGEQRTEKIYGGTLTVVVVLLYYHTTTVVQFHTTVLIVLSVRYLHGEGVGGVLMISDAIIELWAATVDSASLVSSSAN